MKDLSGSYVVFDSNNATGLGKYFAEKHMSMNVPALNEFVLYYDANHFYDFEEYQVAEIRTPLLQVKQVVDFDSPFIKLYPDRIELEYSNAEPSLPFQDLFFSSPKEKFEVECEGSAVLNQQNFGLVLKVEGDDESPNYKLWNMFKAPVYLSSDDLEVSIDTFADEYALGALVEFDFINCGVGARAAFEGRTPDEFTITADKDVNTTMGGIPITFSKFKFGAEDIKPALDNRDFSQLKIVGGLDIEAAKISAFFPSFEEFVGDISVLSMPETKVELDLDPLGFSAEAKLMFLEEIELANAGLQVGAIEGYSNELLELAPTTVYGLRAYLGTGLKWEIDNCKVDISATGEIDALNRFFGVQLRDAGVHVDIKWWLFNEHIDKEADALLGLYITEKGKPQFMLILSYEGAWDKQKKICLYINEDDKGIEDSMKKIK